MNDQQNDNVIDPEVVDVEGQSQTPAASSTGLVAVAPNNASEEELSEVEAKVQKILELIEQGDRREAGNVLRNLGTSEQNQLNATMGLLETRVGELLETTDSELPVVKSLAQLRLHMDELNPHLELKEARSAKGLKRLLPNFLRKVPGIGEALANIALKYETVKEQIDAVMISLRSNQDQILEDNIELEDLYDQLVKQQQQVLLAAYAGELIATKLQGVYDQADDATKRRRIETLLNFVTTRALDLRTVQEVNNQFFISIDMTIENNNSLHQSISRTITVSKNALYAGIALQVALANQKQAFQAMKLTQQQVEQLLIDNSESIKQQGIDIERAKSDPVLAIERIEEAHNNLIQAMDEIEQISREGRAKATRGLAQYRDMAKELEPRVQALHEGREVSEGVLDTDGSDD